MKLKDLIGAFATEIDHAQARLQGNLEILAERPLDDPAFLDALEEYTGQTQRMGEAAELAGMPGLNMVCEHVVENSIMLAAKPSDERIALINFLHDWPPLIIHYLQNISDPSAAAGLIDYLSHAPLPLDEGHAMKMMHKLGALPVQVDLVSETEEKPRRPVVATAEDVELVIPDDVDQNFLEGFFQEAPEQAQYLLKLAGNLASGEGDSSDIIAAKRVMHTLKGSGYTIGLRGIAALGHHLEDILEYCESQGSQLPAHVATVLLDSAYCVEQMIGYLTGNDDFPAQAQDVLQAVLDLANQIDAGVSLETAPRARGAVARVTLSAPDAAPAPAATGERRSSAAAVQAADSLRVGKKSIENLFQLSGEISVGSTAMEAGLKSLVDSSRELLAQNLRVQKRMLELEAVIQMRTLTRQRSSNKGASGSGFDQLEMDQYNELHSTSNALAEEAADSRAIAMRLEEQIAKVAGQHTAQQRLAKDLQYQVLTTRMTEVGTLESRLRRNVRSVCQATGKEVEMVLEGGATMVDGELLNKMAEPLLHLLRNAVDHGIEMPEVREARGKPRTGRIMLHFSRQGQQVVLRCQDDGCGLDFSKIREIAIQRGLMYAGQEMSASEISRMILMPGFSTRDEVSEVSGRGVGMDVVYEWVSAINGSIHIDSHEGKGCLFELRFAATLSTMSSLVVQVGDERFAIPSMQVDQVVARGIGEFTSIGDSLVYQLGKKTYPAIQLASLTGVAANDSALEEQAAVIVKSGNKLQALIVDRLQDARELLISNPGRFARHLRGVAGLSILGDGAVAVNLDMAQLLSGEARAVVRKSDAGEARIKDDKPKVMIVDDSLSVRNSLSQLVGDSGFRFETARDGIEAIQAMTAFRPDIVLTDLEMPNMNGVELTYHIRERSDIGGIPVVMITSRSQEKHRRMAEQAGVSAYITKPYNEAELVQIMRRAVTH